MDAIVSKALELWDTGWSIGEIAEELNVSNKYVTALLEVYATEEAASTLRDYDARFFENHIPEFDW